MSGGRPFPQGCDSAFQLHRIPENDGGNDQVESTGTVALVLEAAVAQVALPMEGDGSRECAPAGGLGAAENPSRLQRDQDSRQTRSLAVRAFLLVTR
jgi:hypothetical protein